MFSLKMLVKEKYRKLLCPNVLDKIFFNLAYMNYFDSYLQKDKSGKEKSLNHGVGSGGRVDRRAMCDRQRNEYQDKN